MTPHEVDTVLADWNPADVPRWITRLNVWQWPLDCPIPCPPHFADLSHARKRQVAQPLWDYLHARTSRAAISRAWWLEYLGRPEAEWKGYWTREVCDCLQCFGLPREMRGRHEDIIQEKLNELVRAVPDARNERIGLEKHLPEETA